MTEPGHPPRQGLYDPRHEHDACGIGFVVNIKGTRSNQLVRQALTVLVNLDHRGASGAEANTGDGAGILMQIPHHFLQQACRGLGIDLPEPGQYGTGTVFLPPDRGERHTCEKVFEEMIAAEGQKLLGWRTVPTDNRYLGTTAKIGEPFVRQVFIGRSPDISDDQAFERRLYVIRKSIERAVVVLNAATEEFYICSLSARMIVYKGMIACDEMSNFFHDLHDESVVSAFAMVHSRFSTNTLGEWKLAHPYRHVVHNGEINTLRGNINWMHARESMFASPDFGDDITKLSPIITPGASDTAGFDNALELLMHTGRSLPHSLMMMIPEAWERNPDMPAARRDFYEYHAALMEPWDGPALIAATDGTRVAAILDRNGLRPFRYTVTKDDLLVMGSETGVLDIPPAEVAYKGRLSPGRMFLVDPSKGRIIGDEELKNDLAARRPYGEWLAANKTDLADLPTPGAYYAGDPSTRRQRQRAFGYSTEDLNVLIRPMAATGGEPIGSMGNDAPLAVLSDQSPQVFGYFKQLFAQVSNPPLDAIREQLVTSVETFIGSEGNLFDETPEQCRQLKLNEPVLTNRELEKIKELGRPGLRARTLSTLFRPQDGPGALEAAMDSLCEEAVRAVSDGHTIIILSDRGVDGEHAPIPSLLATAGVHQHLIREGTRTKVGLVIESGEPREVAHFALLFGYGAAAVNGYLVLETVDELADGDPALDGIDSDTAESNFVAAVHKGVVKVMSKMGISTLQSYRGAQIFEAVGLKQEFIDRYFIRTPSRIGGIGVAEIEEESRRRHGFAYLEPKAPGAQQFKSGGMY
ncbi:MAG: glutamate synthase central domain-containing protein [Candidatus Brocadiia bacterium]|nr:glutamate synthase central domain-containing protein [Candidatus Brocadiia bacterium]